MWLHGSHFLQTELDMCTTRLLLRRGDLIRVGVICVDKESTGVTTSTLQTRCGQTMNDNREITRRLLSESTSVNRENNKQHTGLVHSTDLSVLLGFVRVS